MPEPKMPEEPKGWKDETTSAEQIAKWVEKAKAKNQAEEEIDDWDDDFATGEEKIDKNPEKFEFAKAYGERVTKVLTICLDAATSLAMKHPEASGLLFDTATNVGTFIIGNAALADLRRFRPAEIEIKRNPEEKPIMEILQNGISLFQSSHPDIPVYYTRREDYLDFGRVTEIFNNKIENLTIKGVNYYLESDGITDQPEVTEDTTIIELVTLGMTLQSQKILVHAQHEIESHLPDPIKEIVRSAEQGDDLIEFSHIKDRYDEQIVLLRTLWERAKSHPEIPLTFSEILFRALEHSDGNLSQALYLTASFYRTTARSTVQLTFPEENSAIKPERINDAKRRTEWFATHIKDEFSPALPFTDLSDKNYHRQYNPNETQNLPQFNYDYNRENQIGKPYHVAHMIALLNVLPPEFIACMTTFEYIKYGDRHGLSKLWADFKVLKQMRTIESWLNGFPTSSAPVPPPPPAQ